MRSPRLAVPAEPDDVGQKTQRRRQAGHRVPVEPDNQARVLAPGIERQRPFVLEICTAGRAETAQQTAFDGRGVQGQTAGSAAPT